jgi:hypothetical protein
MKKSKLELGKFQILKLWDLQNVKGGTNTTEDPTAPASENTTYTTDPDVKCPEDITVTNSDPGNGQFTIPTFGSIETP